MTLLQEIWYALIVVLLAGYVVLDGFDLGSGFWYLVAKKKEHRETIMASITPFWDGNEVWLITAGGALFAAFPAVYASVFSSFYIPLWLVLFALVFRAVSIEFRAQDFSEKWDRAWDACFAAGSILAALLFGVAMGNVLLGIEINANGDYTGTLLQLLNPYALLIGVAGLTLFATHGALWIAQKSEGELEEKAKVWAKKMWTAYASFFIVSLAATIWVREPANGMSYWVGLLPACIGIGLIPRFLKKDMVKAAFISSGVAIVGIFTAIAFSRFPVLLPALHNPENSLTAANSSSSELTLGIMLTITLIFMPLVLFYTVWVHKAFGGKAASDLHY